MTTTLTITGSGCPIPSADRAGPGALVQYGDMALQFDAGRSTVQRLAGVGLWPTALDAVFVTHHHSDHVVALQDVVLTRWVMTRGDDIAPLPIVVPVGPAKGFVEGMLDVWEADLEVRRRHAGRTTKPKIDLIAFDIPDAPTEVWRSGDVVVIAGEVRHEPVHPAVGFRVETPDGVVVISGDTLVCDEMAALAEGADVLVYEAMRFEMIEALPEHRRYILDYHADTRLIGGQVKELGVRTLVLTHLIPEPHTDADRQLFIDDIRSGGFAGEIIVANDLDSVTI